MFLRSAAAIRKAATVFSPRDDHDPVKETSTPILTRCFDGLAASTSAAGTSSARSRILIGKLISKDA
jgi:hypothetical protein